MELLDSAQLSASEWSKYHESKNEPAPLSKQILISFNCETSTFYFVLKDGVSLGVFSYLENIHFSRKGHEYVQKILYNSFSSIYERIFLHFQYSIPCSIKCSRFLVKRVGHGKLLT